MAKREEEEQTLIVTTTFCLQHPRAVYALRLNQNLGMIEVRWLPFDISVKKKKMSHKEGKYLIVELEIRK